LQVDARASLRPTGSRQDPLMSSAFMIQVTLACSTKSALPKQDHDRATKRSHPIRSNDPLQTKIKNPNESFFRIRFINYFWSSEDWRSDLPFLLCCFLRTAYNHRPLIGPRARCGVCENCRLRCGRESSIIRHAAWPCPRIISSTCSFPLTTRNASLDPPRE
jgi:hypothetical protein